MTWARFDDNFPDDPRIDAVGPLGGWLHFCAVCYCNRNLTDGFIPQTKAPRLAVIPNPKAIIALLLEQSLWHLADGGYLIDNYLKDQPSREQVLKERERNRLRVERWRAGNSVTNTVSSNVDAHAASAPSPSHPIPLRTPPQPPTALGEPCSKDTPIHSRCRGCGTDRRTRTRLARSLIPVQTCEAHLLVEPCRSCAADAKAGTA